MYLTHKRYVFYTKTKEIGFHHCSLIIKRNHYDYNILSPFSSKYVDLCTSIGYCFQILKILKKSNKNGQIVLLKFKTYFLLKE